MGLPTGGEFANEYSIHTTYTPGTQDIINGYVTFTFTAYGNDTCADASFQYTLYIVDDPSINLQPIANQTICVGGNANTLNVGYINGIGNPTYQWYENGIAITGATTDNYTPPSYNTINTYN